MMPMERFDVVKRVDRLDSTPIRVRLRLFAARCTHLCRLSTRMYREQLGQPARIHHRRREREDQIDLLASARLNMLSCVTSAPRIVAPLNSSTMLRPFTLRLMP